MFEELYAKLCIMMSKIGFLLQGGIMYIGGSDTLPAPLSREEEAILMEQLMDEKKRANARSRLIEHNLRLVVYISRRFENTGIGIEDLISIGTIGLIKAVETYQPEKNIRLATYSSRCIENEILKNSDEVWLERIALADAINRLSEREQRILELRFFQGKTQMEVSSEIGISQAQVSRLEKNALKQIRKEM